MKELSRRNFIKGALAGGAAVAAGAGLAACSP
ncbi:twin-arginine translocation signal domain-containing protein, partial [Eggerthella sinensis]